MSDSERERVMALGPVNTAEYDHELASWFTPEQMRRMYLNNPSWATLEQELYGDLYELEDERRAAEGRLMAVWEILELVEPEESEEHLRTWFIEVPRAQPGGRARAGRPVHDGHQGLGGRAATRARRRSSSSTTTT